MKTLRRSGTAKRRRLKFVECLSREVRYTCDLGRHSRKGSRLEGAGEKGGGEGMDSRFVWDLAGLVGPPPRRLCAWGIGKVERVMMRW